MDGKAVKQMLIQKSGGDLGACVRYCLERAQQLGSDAVKSEKEAADWANNQAACWLICAADLCADEFGGWVDARGGVA